MKFCTVAYLPPASKFNTTEFKANLKEFKTTNPLYLFSDTAHDIEGLIRTSNPEPKGPGALANKWFTNNRVFFTACRIAITSGATHFCYLESDCRIGRDGWDQILWEEFQSYPLPIVIGGTKVVYNPCNAGLTAALRWSEDVKSFSNPGKLPIATYGWLGAADASGSCVFVNGALGVYDLSEIGRLFDLGNSGDEAIKSTAWDMEIGKRLWKIYGPDVYYLVGHLNSVFSTYGNVLTSEELRLQWLKQGRINAVHQIKNQQKETKARSPSLKESNE